MRESADSRVAGEGEALVWAVDAGAASESEGAELEAGGWDGGGCGGRWGGGVAEIERSA